MRHRILCALCVSGVILGAIYSIWQYTSNLEETLAMSQMMYERDTALAYLQGHEHGVMDGRQAWEASISALTITLSRYTDPNTAKQYAEWIAETSIRYGVPVIILAGMIMQESSCNPKAVSKAGARGLTQIIWRYWGRKLINAGIARQESDLYDPRTSIDAGGYILGILLDH